jgi:hypothetical protein
MSIDGGLRVIFRRHLPEFFWTSIETGGTGRGIPDSHYIANGVAGWVEYKQTDGWTVGLSEFQAAWLHRYARHGGRAWIAVRRVHGGGPRLGDSVDQLWLIPGAWALVARAEGLRSSHSGLVQAGAHWGGGPAKWSWEAVSRYLTG